MLIDLARGRFAETHPGGQMSIKILRDSSRKRMLIPACWEGGELFIIIIII